jgi:hypothetical protein
MRCLLLCLNLLFAAQYRNDAAAQPPDPLFKVLQLPRKAGVSRDQLNQKLSTAKNISEAWKTLRSGIPGIENYTVVIRVHLPGRAVSWWTLPADGMAETSTDFTLLRSKYVPAETIYRLQDLRETLADTIFAFDTLAVRVRMTDLPPDSWFVEAECGGGKRTIRLPAGLPLSHGITPTVKLNSICIF